MRRAILGVLVLAVTLAMAVPASAEICLQMSGALSGDLGFFRFRANMPKKPGEMADLSGRVAGLSPAFGTATRAKDDSYIELAATFFSDATQGQFDVFLDPPLFTTGSGMSGYGVYGVADAVTVEVVNCQLEP